MPEANRNQPEKKRKTRRRKRPLAATIVIRFLQTVGTLILVAVLTGSMVCCYAAIYVKTVAMPIAKQTDLSAYTMDENTRIYYYDKNGFAVELATLSGAENRELVPYSDIPQDLIDAYVAIEDKRFWEHDGVDWYRTAGAVVNMFLSMRNTFGGSTITQQLVKNVTEYDDGTVKRKVVEIFTALEVERNYEKEDILAWYMNEIFLGNGCYGVQAAAQLYFGKDVSELSLAECASLAGITNNPSLYSPYGTVQTIRYLCADCESYYSLDPEDACPYCGTENYHEPEVWDSRRWNKARQETILKEMAKPDISPNGAYITQEELEAAIAEELVFAIDKDEDELAAETAETDSKAATNIHPWYVDAVISEVIADLREEGYSENAAAKMVYSGGLSIFVPYDPEIQAIVDEIYTNRENLNYISKTGQQMSSAITVIDNSTGYVVAIAGDIGEKTVNRGWNNALTTRQPGSSIKPLAVYGPALEFSLITPASISDDNPREYNEKPWPVNAPLGWRGLTTIQSAVVRSVNTIAVNVLEQVTPQMSYEFMTERFKITSLVKEAIINGQVVSDINSLSPFAMGGLTNGMSTFEMAAAYASFPRNGAFTEPTTYLLVKDYDGQILINNTPKTEFVIKESTAYYMNTMLTEAVNTGTGYQAKINGHTVAGKTGTTSNMYDLWFAGYTPYYTAAVWTGYPINEYMNISGNPSVVLWQKVMALIHEDLEQKVGFNVPDGLKDVTICLDCGNLANESCTKDLRGRRTQTFKLLKEDRPTEYCACHVSIIICTESPILNENGGETGAYYMAAELCPEECRREISMVDYQRILATEEVVVNDQNYLLSIYSTIEDPYCHVHVEEEEPLPIDPEIPDDPTTDDPTMMPSDDPYPGDTSMPPETEDPSNNPEPEPSSGSDE